MTLSQSCDPVHETLAAYLADDRDAALGLDVMDKCAVISALYQRQRQGARTALREVHSFAGIHQSSAVRILQNFRENGLVVFEFPMSDALAADIQIPRLVMKHLEKIGVPQR